MTTTLDRASAGFDRLTRFWLEPAPVRGVVARLDTSLADAFRHHRYPPAIVRLLQQLAGAALLLASNLKQEAQLILQAQGDGRVPLLCVEANNQLQFRCYAQLREGAHFGDDEALAALLSDQRPAHFALSIKPQVGQMYQGIIALDAGQPASALQPEAGRCEVALLLERYLSDSQQSATRLWLRHDGDALEALLLERLPGQDDEAQLEAWQHSIAQAEASFAQPFMPFPYAEWLQFTFPGQTVRATEAQPLAFACACSRSRVLDALKLVGEAELQPLIEEHGQIETQCDFCGQRYTVDRDAFHALFHAPDNPDAARQAPGSSSLH